MDFKTFLENFDAIAEAPGGIPKLRLLILDLAVRGKLVPQNPEDESTLNLLHEAWQKWSILAKQKKIKDLPKLEPLSKDEVYQVPKGWIFCRLGQAIRLINGRAYKQTELLSAGTPVIRIQNLNGGQNWYYSDLVLDAAWAFIRDNWHILSQHCEDVDGLRRSVLQLAIKGKVVHQSRDDEQASLLLEKIQLEKTKLINAKRLSKLEVFSPITKPPFKLPDTWQWCRVGDLTTIRGGKRLPPGSVLTKSPTSYIYIRVSDMKNGTIDDSDLHYLDKESYKKIKNYIIETQDLYLTIVGATIGKLGIVPAKFHEMNLTENAARIIPHKVDRLWLRYFLNSKFVQDQFFTKTNQLGQPKLALKRVASTLIPLPPLAEQKRIVAKVDELMQLCDQLEASLRQSEKRAESLAASAISHLTI